MVVSDVQSRSSPYMASEAEKEEALRLEAEEAKVLALEDTALSGGNGMADTGSIDKSAFNAATGSYSGLYGQACRRRHKGRT